MIEKRSTFDLDEYVFDALHPGASGYLLIESFIRDHPRTCKPPPELQELTPREAEILTLVARGLSNAEIAEELVVSGTNGYERQDARRPV